MALKQDLRCCLKSIARNKVLFYKMSNCNFIPSFKHRKETFYHLWMSLDHWQKRSERTLYCSVHNQIFVLFKTVNCKKILFICVFKFLKDLLKLRNTAGLFFYFLLIENWLWMLFEFLGKQFYLFGCHKVNYFFGAPGAWPKEYCKCEKWVWLRNIPTKWKEKWLLKSISSSHLPLILHLLMHDVIT